MAMKAQLKRIAAAFPGSDISVCSRVDNFPGSTAPLRRYTEVYASKGTPAFAQGATGHEAVNNLIAANRSTSAGQEAGSAS